jgi:hypothetical protein
MRRLVVLLSVVALMVVMLAMSVAPAFARGPSADRCEILIDNYYLRGGDHGQPPPACYR